MSEFDDGADESIELYPPWKEALKAFQAAGYSYGSSITKAWLMQAFGMPPIGKDDLLTEGELDKRKFEWLQQFTPFRAAVLEQFQMDLVTDRAGAYIILMPKDQPARAFRDGIQEITRAAEKMTARIRNTNTTMLSAEERKAMMDVYAKAADLASRMGATRRLPIDGYPPPSDR